MQKFDGEDYRSALLVFFSGEPQMAGPCRSPLLELELELRSKLFVVILKAETPSISAEVKTYL